jgi:hypothetical protein
MNRDTGIFTPGPEKKPFQAGRFYRFCAFLQGNRLHDFPIRNVALKPAKKFSSVKTIYTETTMQ